MAAPQEIARQLKRLLSDGDLREDCGRALQRRVKRYYNKTDIDRTYGNLYRRLIKQSDDYASAKAVT